MRHYDRSSFRHLNDSERYRDLEYLGDDGWIGANERIPHGAASGEEPPWSTLGGWEARPFVAEHAFDEERGQGRAYGRDFGLGYGREYDPASTFERTAADDYDRGYGRPRDATERQEYPREPFILDERIEEESIAAPGAPSTLGRLRDLGYDVLHTGQLVRRVVRGIFHGKGPKNWVRPDARIRDEVCELLANDPEIDASEIEVTVKDGEVTLEGVVDDRRTKRLAEHILDDVLGVKDVHNRLRVAHIGRETR